MGIEYMYRNLDAQEFVDLADLPHVNSKLPAQPEAARILVYLLGAEWRGQRVEVLGDNEDEAFHDTRDHWKNITAEAQRRWEIFGS